jgi:hypothetical protein
MSTHRPRRTLRAYAVTTAALVTVLVTIALPASASAAVTIGTVGAPGSRGGHEFGGGNSVASIGQVVTVPAGVTTLESFSLSPQAPPTFVFRAYVYAWSGAHTEGSALYESGDLHASSESEYQPLTLHTGGVTVTPGQQYVLFLSRSDEQAADEGSTESYAFQDVSSEEIFELPPYQEGGFVTLSNGYTPSEWGTSNWSDFGFIADAEFEATFDIPTPAPPVISPPSESVKTVTTAPVSTPVVAQCVVPYLGGLELAAVKQALSTAHCALGTVSHHWFSRPKGALMEQNAHQGTILPAGAKVSVWFSRGAHRRIHKRVR